MKRVVEVDYPVVAITDVHGQTVVLQRLLRTLETLPEWPRCSVVFVGDYVDRGPDVAGTVETVVELARRHPAPVAAVAGNHDYALVRSARLDGGPRSDYWEESYLFRYDHEATFRSYLGRVPDPSGDRWLHALESLRAAIPERHREFLGGLPWLVEAPGHLFLHCGLSPELEQSAEEQLALLRERAWQGRATPRPGTLTAELWKGHYPVWLGADKRLSENPLPAPGRVQVTGHRPVTEPDVNGVRIRLDTSGGLREPLTACLLRGATDEPVFIRSDRGLDAARPSASGRRRSS